MGSQPPTVTGALSPAASLAATLSAKASISASSSPLGRPAPSVREKLCSPDVYKRQIYAKAVKDENGCAQLYRYNSDQSGHFASLDGSLVSVSMHQLTVPVSYTHLDVYKRQA